MFPGSDGEALSRFRAAVVRHAENDIELERRCATSGRGQRREGGRVGLAACAQIDVRTHDSGKLRSRILLYASILCLPGRSGGEKAVEHRRKLPGILRVGVAGVPCRSHVRIFEFLAYPGDPRRSHVVIQVATLAQSAQHMADLTDANVTAW